MTTPADIRAWAVANGYPQLAGKRGRLPASVIEAFETKNKAPHRSRGTGTPGQKVRPATAFTATAAKPCRSVITLPLGVEAKAVIAAQDGMCSGCENEATEVVSTKDGQRPESIYEYTALCGPCLCEWRKSVK